MTSRGQNKSLSASSGSGHSTSKASHCDLPASSKIAFDSSRFRIFALIFIVMSLDVISYSAQLPLFPAILNHFYTHDREDKLYMFINSTVTQFREVIGAPDAPRWNSVLFGGMIQSLFCWLQFFSSPMLGALSDRYGRKTVLYLTTTGLAVAYMLWGISSTFSMFLLARVICGLSKGSSGIVTALMSDCMPSEHRTKGNALIGIAYSVGFIVGPQIGSIFSRSLRELKPEALTVDVERKVLFWQPALCSVALTGLEMVAIWCLPETSKPGARVAGPAGSRDSFRRAVNLVNPIGLFRFEAVRFPTPVMRSRAVQMGLINAAYLFIFSGVESSLTLLTATRFNYDSRSQSSIFAFVGVMMLVLQAGLLRRMPPGREFLISLIGIASFIPACLILAVCYDTLTFYAGLSFHCVTSASVVPCLNSMVSGLSVDADRGALLGIFRSLGALARAVGPAFIISMFWAIGSAKAFAIAGAIALVPFVSLFLAGSSVPKKQEAYAPANPHPHSK